MSKMSQWSDTSTSHSSNGDSRRGSKSDTILNLSDILDDNDVQHVTSSGKSGKSGASVSSPMTKISKIFRSKFMGMKNDHNKSMPHECFMKESFKEVEEDVDMRLNNTMPVDRYMVSTKKSRKNTGNRRRKEFTLPRINLSHTG